MSLADLTAPEPASPWPSDFDWSLLFPAEAGSTDWMDYALCVEVDPDAFFPEKHMKADGAKRICDRCEVQDECLAYAQATRTPEGVWGGVNARERRRLRGELERAATAGDPGLDMPSIAS